MQKVPGHVSSVLQLVANLTGPADAPVRQGAAVHFKNLVKKGWDTSRQRQPTEDGAEGEEYVDATEGIRIGPDERANIKNHLVELMCTAPPQIQQQLSESIALIAATDYHEQWESLLPSLARQFEAADTNTVIGVLETANSVFKMFRYKHRGDVLYHKIAYTLKGLQVPLTVLMQRLGDAVFSPQIRQDRAAAERHLHAIRLVCRIVFSLNYQDLPEYFEDNMGVWMTEFAKYLQPGVLTVVEDPDEDDQPSALDKVQAAIVDMLRLYADKDEDVFVENYLGQFTQLVGNRLMALSLEPKHDVLANKATRFVSSLVIKPQHKPLFEGQGVLENMVERIIIPFLRIRESDEEHFEENPHEYMVTEVEGSDSESRRTCVQELLRSMTRNLQLQTTTICQRHIQVLLQQATSGDWKSKDVAVRTTIVLSLFFGYSVSWPFCLTLIPLFRVVSKCSCRFISLWRLPSRPREWRVFPL